MCLLCVRIYLVLLQSYGAFFFSSRRRHTRWPRDWSSDVCSSDLGGCDGERRDRDPGLRETQLRIGGEVADHRDDGDRKSVVEGRRVERRVGAEGTAGNEREARVVGRGRL